jgi:sporulation protein YlmC with PRC-barrel domain
MPKTHDNVLVKLSDASLMLSDPTQDIRDRKVIDQDGDDIGHVSGLFVDKDQKKIRILQVAAGGFLGLGERHFLIPVEAISSITKDDVRINHTRERVVNSPPYDPNLTDVPERDMFEPYYGYYGYAPYWSGSGNLYGTTGYPII